MAEVAAMAFNWSFPLGLGAGRACQAQDPAGAAFAPPDPLQLPKQSLCKKVWDTRGQRVRHNFLHAVNVVLNKKTIWRSLALNW